MQQSESFSNRWGIILASLAMAIGAGNLWRFPRLAGQYGGSFILLWIVFLLIWSIPILLAEFSIGKRFKHGTISSFTQLSGKPYTWMGFFITLCTLFITFYYSVVTAWSVRYMSFSLQDVIAGIGGSNTLSDNLSSNPDYLKNQWATITNADFTTMVINIIVVIVGCVLLYKGIQNGLEKANRIFIPTLFVLLIIISVIALTLDGGSKGLEYMFAINPDHFSNPNVWIEALSQSAWSTGAGWGLIMTISSYAKEKEDVTLNTFIGGFGNNTASLMAGMAILPAVFALAPSETDALSYLQAGNQALTFTIIPKLFSTVPGGSYLSLFFFTAFTLAAFSSLLPML
ncbi:MAG: sodium-dependent transporter, partial [Calditrichaeota bacterium]|nr:sodium-dependent transporter [Calditrichota bacterium]